MSVETAGETDLSVGKIHVSIVICGHVDSGKSTTTGRLLYELKGISPRELEKYRAEAEALGKSSFMFAFIMDKDKDERERGVTIVSTLREFFTFRFRFTIIDAPGHRDFVKNMITGAAQADVCALAVPADGNFTTAIQKGDHAASEVPGQTRQHARLVMLLGIKQVIIIVNKMDAEKANYSQERFLEIKNEMIDMMCKVGHKKEAVLKSIPIIPISGWVGDNIITKSEKMPWWNGETYTNMAGEAIHCTTFLDCLDKFVCPPVRKEDAPARMCIQGVHKVKGAGDVCTGKVCQGVFNKGQNVCIIGLPPAQKLVLFSIEMHYKVQECARAGDNVGVNIKGLQKGNMPKTGYVMIDANDKTIGIASSFVCQIQTVDVINQISVNYTPTTIVRSGRSPCRLVEIHKKMSKAHTGGAWVENPTSIMNGETALVTFEAQKYLVVEDSTGCEELSRVAFLEGNTCVMLGRVMKVNRKG